MHELTTRSRSMNTQSAADHVEYLTMREAADRYHVSVMTVRRRIRAGKLPAVQCGSKLIRISAQALDAIFTPVPNSTSWV